MKIRYFFAAIVASLALAGSAQAAETAEEPMYMVLTLSNGDLKAIDINKIDRLTFDGGKMTVKSKDASAPAEQYPVSDLNKMKFSSNPTGAISFADVAAEPAGMAFDGAELTFEGVEGKELTVYNAAGALVIRHTTAKGLQTLDLGAVAPGVYVVNYNGKSLKIKK